MPEQERISNFRTIIGRVRSIGQREEKITLLRGLFFACAGFLGLILLVSAVEAIFRLSTSGRLLLFAAAAIASLGLLAWQAGPALLRMSGLLPGASEDSLVFYSRGGHCLCEV